MVHSASDTEPTRLDRLRYKLMLLDHKNGWSKQDQDDREWLRDEIEKEAKNVPPTATRRRQDHFPP